MKKGDKIITIHGPGIYQRKNGLQNEVELDQNPFNYQPAGYFDHEICLASVPQKEWPDKVKAGIKAKCLGEKYFELYQSKQYQKLDELLWNDLYSSDIQRWRIPKLIISIKHGMKERLNSRKTPYYFS